MTTPAEPYEQAAKAFTDATNVPDSQLFGLIAQQIYDLPANFVESTLNTTAAGTKYKELEIFITNNPADTQPLTHLFKQTTTFGEVLFKHILLNPTTDINTLTNRQNIIQLLTGTNIYQRLQHIIAHMNSTSNDGPIMSLLQSTTPEIDQIHKLLYFDTPVIASLFNNSPLLLNIYYAAIMMIIPLYGVLSPLTILILPYVVCKYIFQLKEFNTTMYIAIIKKIFGNVIFGSSGIFGISHFAGIAQHLTSETFGLTGIMAALFTIIKLIILILNSPVGKYIYIGFMIFSYIYGIYNCLISSNNYRKLIALVHKRCIHAATVIRTAKLLADILQDNNELTTLIRHNKDFKQGMEIKHYFNKQYFLFDDGDAYDSTHTHKFLSWDYRNTIIDLHNSTTFDTNSSEAIFLNRGKILVCYNNIVHNPHMLVPFIRLIGVVDAYISISQLIHTHSNNICYSEYITDSDAPCITGTNIINAHCFNDHNNDNNDTNTNTITTTDLALVGNDIEMKDKNVIIISGPNGSGKSTYIKSIAESIIFSQTIGIAMAKTFKFTLFKYIDTYLNIPDCQGKESLFQAEMNRCYTALKNFESCEDNDNGNNSKTFTFNIMDEIFVSTNQYEGISGAYAVIKRLAKFKNSLHIITTHFDIITRMRNSRIDKWYFTVHEDKTTGELTKTYKILHGVNKKHMALTMLKNKGFDKDIITDANRMYKYLTIKMRKLNSKTPPGYNQNAECLISTLNNNLLPSVATDESATK